jgi:hypothetical protein
VVVSLSFVLLLTQRERERERSFGYWESLSLRVSPYQSSNCQYLFIVLTFHNKLPICPRKVFLSFRGSNSMNQCWNLFESFVFRLMYLFCLNPK